MASSLQRQIGLLIIFIIALAGIGYVLKPFLLALATGAVFAFSLFPLRNKLEKTLGHHRTVMGATLTSAFVLTILAPLGLLSYQAFQLLKKRSIEGESFFALKTSFGKMLYNFSSFLDSSFGISFPYKKINEFLAYIEKQLIDTASAVLGQMPDTTVQVGMMIATMYVVLSQGESKMLIERSFFMKKWARTILKVIIGASKDVILANVLTGFIQASMVSIGALIFTKFDVSFVFVMTFVLSFIPVVGAGPFAALLGAIVIYNDQVFNGIAMVVVSLIVGIADNFIRAAFISREREDSSFLNFVGTIGGIYIWGMAGLFMGPIVVSVCYRILPKVFSRLLALSDTDTELKK